jgi:O-antigen/teichoic acid export membrane protein
MLDFLLLIIKKIKISNFLRNVNILSIGTITSQGIEILASPILSRMFSPNDYDFNIAICLINNAV